MQDSLCKYFYARIQCDINNNTDEGMIKYESTCFTLFLNFLVSQALFKQIGLLPVPFQFLFCKNVRALELTAPTSALGRFQT